MDRYIESWITLPDDLCHKIRSRRQPIEIHRPIFQTPGKRQGQHALRTFSHRLGVQEFPGAIPQRAIRPLLSIP
jgi:hypothetical protein